MDKTTLEIEYTHAWEMVQEAKRNYELARANFHDVCGLYLEQLMIENVDVLARLRDTEAETPTI